MNKKNHQKLKKEIDYRTEFEKKGKPIYLDMSDGNKVRVLDFAFAKKPKSTILLIPGFISVFQSFEKVIQLLSPDYHIYYLETREKKSSVVKSNKDITITRSVLDLKEVVEILGLSKTNDYFVICSSYGATLLIENLSRNWLAPKFAVMIGPTIEMKLKWVVIPFARVAQYSMGPVTRWLVKTYINIFFVNRKRDVEQRAKYMRAVFENDPKKYIGPLKEIKKQKRWDLLPKISTKCLIVGESKDKMHYCSVRAAELIPNATLIDLEVNKATHDQPLIDAMNKYMNQLENEK